MSEPLRYPVPWRTVLGLWRHVKNGTTTSVDRFTASIVARMNPAPIFEGELPADPRFVLAANHYQREGLWILHTAAVLTRAVRDRYGPGDPPVRWIVTANWPPLKLGDWRIASPGDWMLPRVAHALACYPVSFAGSNPAFTARSLLRIIREARTLDRPIGIFPEGVAGKAGVIGEALPGVGRLLERLSLTVVPAHVSEAGRLIVRFGPPIPAAQLRGEQCSNLVMDRIRALAHPHPSATGARRGTA